MKLEAIHTSRILEGKQHTQNLDLKLPITMWEPDAYGYISYQL